MSRKLSTNNNISASCKEGSFPSCFPRSLPPSCPAGTVPALLVPHPRLLQPYSPTRQPDTPRCSRLTLFPSLEKRYSAFLWDSLLDFLLHAVSAKKHRAEKPLPSAPGTLDPSPITCWHRTWGRAQDLGAAPTSSAVPGQGSFSRAEKGSAPCSFSPSASKALARARRCHSYSDSCRLFIHSFISYGQTAQTSP